ncbi:c-type cytochrome [Sphingomonas sp.]|jgi:cytochrome c1|uniref:c-type cytochrome n=1 Tax=Sphingomonas sp. TaxID=28214 RepID=UPI002E3203C1|nr:c-type cytochrome [Sphingomonas sp.]HEX4695204.1 c-type cytochrome [Sphingomonas sp.]
MHWRAIGFAAVAPAVLTGCGHAGPPGEDPQRGAIAITRQACGSCHVIPGIAGADGSVGPPLTHFASEAMLEGQLPNTPANAMRFIRSPRRFVNGSVMPDQDLSDAQLGDVAAYLETLK